MLLGAGNFPPPVAHGGMPAPMFSSSPSGGSESMHLMCLMAITAARHGIDLSSRYFVPDELTVASVVAAAQRGVLVRIITLGQTLDSSIVRHASRSR